MPSATERLQLLYEVNRRLTTFTDLDEILGFATRRTRELFKAEGCSILLLDRKRNEFSFPVASQSESNPGSSARLAEIRFAADRGIAGWVLAHDQAVLVNDVAEDPRFYAGVDRLTQMTTRALACAPLRTRLGNIGVCQVINPAEESFASEDVEFLEALAGDFAVACEKARLYSRLQREVKALRRVCNLAGLAALAVGLRLVVSVVTEHLARALPLGELALRTEMLPGALSIALGVVLFAVARGRIVERTI